VVAFDLVEMPPLANHFKKEGVKRKKFLPVRSGLKLRVECSFPPETHLSPAETL
jgi:hypothetical protein